MNKINNFLKDVRLEINKVIFPSINNIKLYLINVTIVVVVMTVYLTIVDSILQKIIQYILN
jgi:preprotein translocase subunit SecE